MKRKFGIVGLLVFVCLLVTAGLGLSVAEKPEGRRTTLLALPSGQRIVECAYWHDRQIVAQWTGSPYWWNELHVVRLNSPSQKDVVLPFSLQHEEPQVVGGAVFLSPSQSKAVVLNNGEWLVVDSLGRTVNTCRALGNEIAWLKDESGWIECAHDYNGKWTELFIRKLNDLNRRIHVDWLDGYVHLIGLDSQGRVVLRDSSSRSDLKTYDLRNGQISDVPGPIPTESSNVMDVAISPDGASLLWVIVEPSANRFQTVEWVRRLLGYRFRWPEYSLKLWIGKAGSSEFHCVATEKLALTDVFMYDWKSWSGPTNIQWNPDGKSITWLSHGKLEAISTQ